MICKHCKKEFKLKHPSELCLNCYRKEINPDGCEKHGLNKCFRCKTGLK